MFGLHPQAVGLRVGGGGGRCKVVPDQRHRFPVTFPTPGCTGRSGATCSGDVSIPWKEESSYFCCWNPAVVAERTKALSQIQVERMP